MLVIRLSRTGSKKRPYFRVVVADSTRARDSRLVEILGHYHPRSKPAVVDVNQERLAHWLKAGARPSDTVRTLLAGHVTSQPAAGTPAQVVAPAAETPAQ
jgi:small subunit ribosomal protein S16